MRGRTENSTVAESRSRAAFCLGATPCLSAAYLVSACQTAANEPHSMRWATAMLGAPLLLGSGQILMRSTRYHVPAAAMLVAVLLSPGAYTDSVLAIVFSVRYPCSYLAYAGFLVLGCF